jgi:hypothetical protein
MQTTRAAAPDEHHNRTNPNFAPSEAFNTLS